VHYDVDHLYNAKHFIDRGFMNPPLHLQFVMGIHGGIGATAANLSHMVTVAEDLFGDEFSFSVIGAGRNEFPLTAQTISSGGHARVGLEDNLYILDRANSPRATLTSLRRSSVWPTN
jgi:uncharacterized protein (DUF849 family)